MRELGEEFSEELVNAKFELVILAWSLSAENLWPVNYFRKN
jgi:hypothetical protein